MLETKSPYQPTSDPLIRQQARRSLIVYWIILIPLTLVMTWIWANRIFPEIPNPIVLVPASASIITRLIFREGFSDISFRVGGRKGVKAIGIAWILALLLPLAIYGFAWGTRLIEFSPPTELAEAAYTSGSQIEFIKALLLNSTIFTLLLTFIWLGEEVGWRGFMLTRMIDAGFPKPILLSGLIWVVFHFPDIIMGSYRDTAGGDNPLWLIIIGFTLAVLAINYMISWLRLESGSIWPAAVLHAAWNANTQGTFNRFSHGANHLLWVGESGFLVIIGMVLATILMRKVYARQWDADTI